MKKYWLFIIGLFLVLISTHLSLSIMEIFYEEQNRFREYLYPSYNISFKIMGMFIMVYSMKTVT